MKLYMQQFPTTIFDSLLRVRDREIGKLQIWITESKIFAGNSKTTKSHYRIKIFTKSSQQEFAKMHSSVH